MRYERPCATAAALLMVPIAPSALRSDDGIGWPLGRIRDVRVDPSACSDRRIRRNALPGRAAAERGRREDAPLEPRFRTNRAAARVALAACRRMLGLFSLKARTGVRCRKTRITSWPTSFTSGPRPCGIPQESKSCLSPPHRPLMMRDGPPLWRATPLAMVNSISRSRPPASIAGRPAQRGGRNAPMFAFTRRRPRLRQQTSVRASAASLTSLTLPSSTRRKWPRPAA